MRRSYRTFWWPVRRSSDRAYRPPHRRRGAAQSWCRSLVRPQNQVRNRLFGGGRFRQYRPRSERFQHLAWNPIIVPIL